MGTTENQLKQVILEAVNEGLLILGESSRKAIYFHLQNIVSLKMEDIPENLETFKEGLEKIFGKGAETIEKSIVKTLHVKLGIEYKEKECSGFIECVNRAIENSKVKG